MIPGIYEPATSTYDEAFCPDGAPRPGYEELLEPLVRAGIGATRDALQRRLASMEVGFGDDESTFEVDPLPRLITSGEWDHLSAGLAQRHEAVNAFIDDAYKERSLIDHGVMPARILEESVYYEPMMEELDAEVVAQVAGPDLIRDATGEMLVLEDNVRTPSGIAYAATSRSALLSAARFAEPDMLDPTQAYGLLHAVLRDADPAGAGDPSIAMLSDGPRSKAWFEHREIAGQLNIPVVGTDELESRRDRLFALVGGEPLEVQVLYNRSSEESLRGSGGELSRLGSLLKRPLEAGTVSCVNGFGAGIADDKATHCYVEEMIRFYLDEQPLLRSVPSFDLGDPDQRATVINRLDEFVIKPRWSFGGQGIVLGPRAPERELQEIRSRIERMPSDYVAQEMIEFSVHPTAAGDRLEPRHVDLRAFVATLNGRSTALPLALTRFAGGAGDLVVNSTQGGGAKDTWLLR
jgi:carboxylate-amine ligase